MTLKKHLGYTLIAILATLAAKAQPFSLDKKLKADELVLQNFVNKKDTGWNGKMNVSTVEQTKDTSYYFVKGLSMYQPVYFEVSAKKSTDKLTITLCKDNWKKPDKQGTLNNKGIWKTYFKTEGSFGIMIVSKAPKVTYNIIVWAGKEAGDVGIKSPFKKTKK